MEECLRVEGLCKRYGKREIVKSLDFVVNQGQIFALLGPNGAGKSTTMNMLGTLLSKTRGRVYIDGLDMDIDKSAIKSKIGMVFQEDVLDGELTIYKNLWYRGGLYIPDRRELRARVNHVVKLLSMEGIVERRYEECSGGQRRLAQIARALLSDPKLLILDEPTTGLDPVTRSHVWEVLLKLKKQLHMTIFYTTHYLDEASYADILCILKEGKIILWGSLPELQVQFCSKYGSGESSGRNRSFPDRRHPSLEEMYFQLLKGDNL